MNEPSEPTHASGLGIRSAVAGLAPYRPGKAASQAEAEHNISDAIKLASNENPFPPSPFVVEAVAKAAASANLYPDHRATELRAALAKRLDVDSSQITVGCGSVGLLQQLCLTFVDPGDEVVYPWLSFEAYPVCVKEMGGVPVTVPLVDHRFDLDAVAEAVGPQTKMILLANPNNPTGTAVSIEDIARLVEQVPGDVVVLVDEAYREFLDPSLGDPVTELIPHHRNVVVTRTMSKAYGLAGLRVGYAVADPLVIEELDKVLVPFAVNALAQAGALAALDNIQQIQPSIDRLIADRGRVVKGLAALGISVPDPQANFVFLPFGQETDRVYLALERQGIVTRPFSGTGIRITIGTPEQNDRVLASLSTLVADGTISP